MANFTINDLPNTAISLTAADLFAICYNATDATKKVTWATMLATMLVAIPISRLWQEVRVLTTSATPTTIKSGDAVDGINLAVDDLFLCVNGAATAGIYSVTAANSARYYLTDALIRQATIRIRQGSIYAGQMWSNSNATNINVGTDNITYYRLYFSNQAIETTSSPTFVGLTAESIVGEGAIFGEFPYHYTQFEGDGSLFMSGAATVWEDENFDPTMLTGGGNLPALGTFGSTTISIAQFSGSQTDEVLICKEYPHKAMLNAAGQTGVKLSFHCHCYPTNTSAGNVRLGLEYFFSSEGQAITTSNIIYLTATLPATAWEQKVLTFADITAPENIGCQYHFRFFRLGADALDTATQALAISTIGFHYESDTLGSRQMIIK